MQCKSIVLELVEIAIQICSAFLQIEFVMRIYLKKQNCNA